MFKTLLIANRGEIAIRIMRTAKRLGMRTVAVYSDADRDALHVTLADAAYRIGPARASDSYLNIEKLITAARASGANAVHPGYGFLSENAAFAEAVTQAGLTFVGPPAAAIRAMSLKDAAKALMERAGVPVVPGYYGADQSAAALEARAGAMGYPVLIKARAGGGGKGMRRVDDQRDFRTSLESAQREAAASFGDAHVLLERYVAKPRHIEVQIFADAAGNVIHLGERDCSLQRRHQKVIEESPAPAVSADLRDHLGSIAVRAARAIGYVGAGTVEFIADTSQGLRAAAIYFMEMNTRLQVEHPVTEAVTGLDLVEWQLRVAVGEPLPLTQEQITFSGHALEARVYAEDASRGFLPATGTLHHLRLPERLARVDAGVRQGDAISPFYDPLIAKIIAHAPTRPQAIAKLAEALAATEVAGTVTNISFLQALIGHADVRSGNVDTGLIERAAPDLTRQPEPAPAAAAVAAFAALAHAPSSRDPWTTLAGWRHWSVPQTYVGLEQDGRHLDVHLTGMGQGAYEIATPYGSLNVVNLSDGGEGTLRLETGGRILNATAVVHRRSITVLLDGAAHVFALADRLAADEEDDAVSDRVTSPMPGTIKSVGVAPGAPVTRGQPLIVIEAMKMEYTMTSPRDGKIAEVFVSTGANVEAGGLLLTLAPTSGG